MHLVHLPGSVQTQVLLGNLAITRRDPDWYPPVLANSIYGGAFHSRLVMNIREQKGYTYSPRSGINALRQYGYFTVHAAVRNEVAAATLTEMFYEMDRMRSLPVTPEELESARSYLTGVFSLGVATQDGVLGQLSTVYLDRLPEDYLETYRERIRALTADDVSPPRAAISIPRTRKSSSSATAPKSATKPPSSAQLPNTPPMASSTRSAPLLSVGARRAVPERPPAVCWPSIELRWFVRARLQSCRNLRRECGFSREVKGQVAQAFLPVPQAYVRLVDMRGNAKFGSCSLLLFASAAIVLFFYLATTALAQKTPPTQPINLNTATIAQLETLPGIGPNTAKSIVDFRNHSGPFQRVQDLLAIKGISKSKLEKLRPYVTVGPAAPNRHSDSSHHAFGSTGFLFTPIFRKLCDHYG